MCIRDRVEPRSFSFNNPFGACPECFGLGYKMEFDEDLMIPDKSCLLYTSLPDWKDAVGRYLKEITW